MLRVCILQGGAAATLSVLLIVFYSAMTCAGIDVAKDHLDLAIRDESGEAEIRRFDNDPEILIGLKTSSARPILSVSSWRQPAATNDR